MKRKIDFLLRLSLERGTPVFIGADVARNTYTHQNNKLRLKVEKVKPPPDKRTVQGIIEYFSLVPFWVDSLKISKVTVATASGVKDDLSDPIAFT
ncbi:hypothetical protein MTO96_022218 [Rhipicephalus appendiculatus]